MTTDSIDMLAADLLGPDPVARDRAIEKLGASEDGRAVAPLLGLINDPNAPVDRRNRAGRALLDLGETATLPLLQILEHGPDVRDRLAAVRILVQSEAVEVAKILSVIVTSDSEPESLRRRAAWGIGRLAASQAIGSLLSVLPSASLSLRIDVLRAVGRLGDAAGADALLSSASSSDARERLAAVTALGKIAVSEAKPALVAALQDDDPAVRAAAAIALGTLSDGPAEPLIVAASDSDGRVRRSVAWALGRTGGAGVEDALRHMCEDADSRVRAMATRARANVGEP